MASRRSSLQRRRSIGRRYAIVLFAVMLITAGWIGFWKFAASRAQQTIEGWHRREAAAGRIYDCDSQHLGGFPFRIEVRCEGASALVRSNQPPLEVKARRVIVVAQVYQPGLIISEFGGPLTLGSPGKPADFVANWSLAQSSVRGTPTAPERGSLAVDNAQIERMSGGGRESLLRARHIELHGRIAQGSAANSPVIEIALQLQQTSFPALNPAAVQPVDGNVTAVIRGLKDFSPKPWPVRFREIQAADGRIEITTMRLQQGETLAVGGGTLSINTNGHLEGELRVTMTGLEQFLTTIGARERIQASPSMDRIVGALDRIAPGLGNVARQQAGANLSLGINLIGEQTTLEGRQAVKLPVRFSGGSVFLGPVPIGNTPALF